MPEVSLPLQLQARAVPVAALLRAAPRALCPNYVPERALNLAVGGNFDGDPRSDGIFPATMLVDYVRVYKAAGK